MCRDRYIYLLRQWRVKNFKDIFAKIWGQSIKGSCKEMQCWSLECSAMKIPRRKWIKVNYVDFSERMRTLVEKGDCHLVSLLSALLTLAIVLSWSSPWIKMITMMRLLISCPFLMMYIYHDALPHGNDKVQNQVGFVPRRQLSPPIVWEPFHAKIISNDHAAPVALTNIYCWVQPTTAKIVRKICIAGRGES